MEAAPIALLADDLLRAIFLRLPSPAALLRAALACKAFRRAALNAAFLRRFRRRHPSSPLLACFLLGPDPDDAAPLFLTASGALASGDFSLAFLPHGGWSAAWQILDCRNGRLLLKNENAQELAVADPLAGTCFTLPPPPAEHLVGYGLLADDGDLYVFRVVCLARDGDGDGDGSRLRAVVFSSGAVSWADAVGFLAPSNLAGGGGRAMQANGSLYWRLEGGDRMLALDTATMEFSTVKLPRCLWNHSLDVIDKGEGGGGIYVLAMPCFRIGVWVGREDGAGGRTWRRVEASVCFRKAMSHLWGRNWHALDGLVVVGVVAGVLFLCVCDSLLFIDLQTMRMTVMSSEGCSSALIYLYAMPWPPYFLSPAGEDA